MGPPRSHGPGALFCPKICGDLKQAKTELEKKDCFIKVAVFTIIKKDLIFIFSSNLGLLKK